MATTAAVRETPDQARSAPGAGAPVSVAQRPALGPGVRLAGPLRDSAFQDPPWLIEVEGLGYYQVSELIYRIVEQLDGEHTFGQIATTLGRTTRFHPSAEDVRALIAGELVPLGIVVNAAAAVSAPTARPGLLALNVRRRVLDARLIDLPARLLQYFFWPPVLLAVLAVSAVAQGYLYLAPGARDGWNALVSDPATVLPLLGLVLLASAFHELGHASALRYGGGRARAMGVGLYLIWPAFYTDITDSYRLGRWGRVRTDLGGLYFNLIFDLGLFGLYGVSGQPLFLLAVTVINVLMLNQLMPFVRLDGYWLLADLSGIPDFFSQMCDFVRSVVPLRVCRGRKLPALHWWAKGVFALYMLVTMPLLGFALVQIGWALPRVAQPVWQGILLGSQQLLTDLRRIDLLAGLIVAVQIVLLALQVLGLAILFALLARNVLRFLWHAVGVERRVESAVVMDSKHPAPRRAAGRRSTNRAARRSGSEDVETVLGGRSRLHGTFTAEGPIRVVGCVEGDIESRTAITVAAGAHVVGQVVAAVVTVEGEVAGAIRCGGALELRAGGRVVADVHTRTLVIERGGTLDGQVRMVEEIAGEPAPATDAAHPTAAEHPRAPGVAQDGWSTSTEAPDGGTPLATLAPRNGSHPHLRRDRVRAEPRQPARP